MLGIHQKTFFLILFLVVTSLNFRLRIYSDGVHMGGAEFAIAPYDFFIPILLIFALSGNGGRLLKVDRVNFCVFLFILFSSLSIFSSARPDFVIYEIFRHIKIFLLFVILRRLFLSNINCEAIPNAVVLLVIFQLFYAVSQLMLGSVDVTEDASAVKDVFTEGGVTRVAGTLRNPTLLSLYVNLLLPFLFVGLSSHSHKKTFFFAICMTFVVILLTYTRTQLVMYFFICCICLFMMKNTYGRPLISSTLAKLGVAFALLILLVVVYYKYDELYTRVVEAPETSLTTRIFLNVIAINMFMDNLFFGAGWNNFIYQMPFYDPFGLSITNFPVHNLYLMILSETGVFSFIMYIYINFHILRSVRCVTKRSSELYLSNLGVAVFASIVAMLLTGMQGWSFRSDSIQIINWMVFALGVSIADRHTKNIKEK